MVVTLLGQYLRMVPLSVAALPQHAAFDSAENKHLLDPSVERPALHQFVRVVLDDAFRLIDRRLETFKLTGRKQSPPAEGDVCQFQQTVSVKELRTISRDPKLSPKGYQNWPRAAEAWFARRSWHAEEMRAGTAEWDEFTFGLKDLHSEHEYEYTPDVYDAHEVLSWNDQLKGLTITSYHGCEMRIMEMCHQMPSILNPRVFPVLVITAYSGSDSFIVAQVPVDISQLHEALYCNGKNTRAGAVDDPQKQKKTTIGMYTSVERCHRNAGNRPGTDWAMATASDAKGNLPMALQKMGVPGAVLKDVGLFMKWAAKRRQP